MTYTIHTYQEGFIEDQFRIGSQLYDPWPMGGQTRPDQLRAAYSTDDFDPETRFYAFDGDEMVGFLTSSFNEEKDGKSYYYFEFPYVLPEHAPQAERQLLDHAITSLQSKGADVLVARAGEYWGKSLMYAKEYGFEKRGDIARRGEIDLQNTEPADFGDPSLLVPYNPDDHLDLLAELLAEKYNRPAENMKKQLSKLPAETVGNTTESPWGRKMTLLSHKVIANGDRMEGRILAIDHQNFSDDAINLVSMITKDNDQELIGHLLAELVRAGKEHDKQTAILHTGLWGVSPDDSTFAPYNISFQLKLAYFEKEL